jgi:hypothetical protein
MSDEPTKKMPCGVIPLDVGCFRRKTPKEKEEERLLDLSDPKNLEAAYWRIVGRDKKTHPPA